MASADQYEELKQAHTALKQRASGLSGDVTRLSKQLGEAHHEIEDLQEAAKANAKTETDLAEARKHIQALERDAAKLQGLAAEGARAVAAGKQVAEGLAALAGR